MSKNSFLSKNNSFMSKDENGRDSYSTIRILHQKQGSNVSNLSAPPSATPPTSRFPVKIRVSSLKDRARTPPVSEGNGITNNGDQRSFFKFSFRNIRFQSKNHDSA